MKGARWDLFPYTSTPNAIMTMYRTEGIGAFYKGLQTKIGKKIETLKIIKLLMHKIKSFPFRYVIQSTQSRPKCGHSICNI